LASRKQDPARRFRRSVTQTLLGGIGVALLTLVCVRLHLNLATTALLYLIVILLLSLTGSFASSALVSLFAVLCLHYFFAAPLFPFGASDLVDVVALIAFLATAFVISRLITRVGETLREVQAANDQLRGLARLLDLTHDSIFVRDLNDVITYWNRGAEELYGWTREEAVGKVTHELLQTISPTPIEAIKETVLRAGRWEGELVHTKRDGTQVTVASRWSLQSDERGRSVGTLETNNDVTERRRAEDALRRSEAYLSEAQRLSHTGSWAWDAVRRENLHWSPEHFRIFGLDPEPVPASFQAARERIHPEDRPRFDEAMDAAVREGTGFETDFRVVLPDGSTKYVHTVGSPVVEASGNLVEFVGTVMDVTERKRAERAIRQARERTLEARFDAVLDERTRLARDIHDTLLQGFTGIALKLLAAIGRVSGPPETVADLREVVDLAQKTLADARRAVWDLRSPSLDGGDFPAALRTAAEDGVRGTGLTLETGPKLL
jgi:PAS domain S-box-containing protein